jgi:hypothetical protein
VSYSGEVSLGGYHTVRERKCDILITLTGQDLYICILQHKFHDCYRNRKVLYITFVLCGKLNNGMPEEEFKFVHPYCSAVRLFL